MTDRETLQLAILQTLENFQRCGLRMLPSIGQLPDDVSARIARLASATESISSSPEQTASQNAITETINSRPMPAAQSSPPSHLATESHPVASDQAKVAEDHQHSSNSTVSSQPLVATNESSFGQWQTSELDNAARHNLFQILDQEIKACRKCAGICDFRQQTVFGVGPIRPTVCFMGEAPGADEDKQGEPFVGRAGQLLSKIIEAMQLKREQVYILNSLKCRPPGNRSPLPDEINNCQTFVETQLETLQPKYIVCLGAVAVRSLLKKETPVGQLRGKFFSYRGAKVLVTYHPSYLLRNESAKRLVWEDMQLLMRELGIELPRK